ncbi:MAG: hypothetical protein VKI42_09365 [Synechococcaceae cyanobacterium]|nr:hypothetical protein [Synechococcaceae cyanobacterium]
MQPPPLLKEIKRYGWPLSPGDSHPNVMLIEPPLGLKPPRRADRLPLEAVAASTSYIHAKTGLDMLKITRFSARWCLPSLLESSNILCITEVDGFRRDVRSLPIEIQVKACAKGLIPDMPALRDQARGQA